MFDAASTTGDVGFDAIDVSTGSSSGVGGTVESSCCVLGTSFGDSCEIKPSINIRTIKNKGEMTHRLQEVYATGI